MKQRLRLSSLFHRVYDLEALRVAYRMLNRRAAPGVDGAVWASWQPDPTPYLSDLSAALASGSYRPLPVRAVRVPKASGGSRLIEVPALRDKVAGASLVFVLSSIYGAAFRACDLGFGASRRDSVRRSGAWASRRDARFVLRLDVADCFGSVRAKRLRRVLSRRVADPRILAMAELLCPCGLPQGFVTSPVLCAVYLTHAVDSWVDGYRRQTGEPLTFERYVDDIAASFRSEASATAFLLALRERMASCGLSLAENKTSLTDARVGSPAFLGFEHSKGRRLPLGLKERVSACSSVASLFSLWRYYRGVVSRRPLSRVRRRLQRMKAKGS